MSGLKTLAIAAALLTGGSSLAMAQAPGGTAGSTTDNAAASGGPGTHAGAMRSGSQANSQKVYKNKNGYQPGHQ